MPLQEDIIIVERKIETVPQHPGSSQRHIPVSRVRELLYSGIVDIRNYRIIRRAGLICLVFEAMS